MTEPLPVLILVGTQTGNAEILADVVAEALETAGTPAYVLDMSEAYPELLNDYHHLVISTSTWGDGELPDNAIDFFEAIQEQQPDLSHLRFGIVALGDHLYDPYFCVAGQLFDELLSGLGATRIAETVEIDEGPTQDDEDLVRSWTETLVFQG
ncbi:MAG: flavodoxin family protein [Bacteroidota bacterium]